MPGLLSTRLESALCDRAAASAALRRRPRLWALLAAAASCLSVPAHAQLKWSAYNPATGALLAGTVFEQAATFDPATNSYAFTIPANTAVTLVTTNILPVDLPKPASGSVTQTITFQLQSSAGGFSTLNKYANFGLFTYSAGNAPSAVSNNATTHAGLWMTAYNNGTTTYATKPCASPNSAGYSFASGSDYKLASSNNAQTATGFGLGTARASGVGIMADNTLYNVTFRVRGNSAGTTQVGSGTADASAGALWVDAATGGSAFKQAVYSSTTNNGFTCPAALNEFAFYFENGSGSPVTLTLANVRAQTSAGTPFNMGPAYFTSQPPSDVTAAVGGTLVVSATPVAASVSGGPTTAYQWQLSTDGGASFSDVSAAGNASAATPSLTITNVQSSHAGLYRLKAMTSYTGAVSGLTTLVSYSSTANVNVTSDPLPPSIVTAPANATTVVGGSANFSVIAGGSTPLSYQWSRSVDGGANYGDIAGATSATYTLANAQLVDSGRYRVTVSNSQGTITSPYATLTVQQAPVITQPVGGTIAPGGTITLSVTATGTPPPTFQWKKNGVNIAGATTASYTIASATGADTANYTVVVSNAVGSVTSAPASVAVVSPTMSAVLLSPSSLGTPNPDTRLALMFNQTPTVGVQGYLRIYDASNDSVVDTVDLVAATALRDTLRASSTLSTELLPVQKKPIGGIPTDFNYYPITVSGNIATIYPRNGVLAYGKTYYVKVDAGVFVNAAGEAFGGIADTTTWRFSTKAGGPASGATSLTVAADGSGDFDTVQAALDFIPAGNVTPRTIRVKNGTYFEEVGFQSKHFVTIVGEDADQTVISYPNNNTFNNVSGVYHRATFVAQSVHDFTLANLTIRNPTPQNGSQAEAIVLNGSGALSARNVVTRCKFFSYQDTVQFNKQTYVSDCTIWGDVDFLWGDGPVYLENCDIRILRTGGYFTQIRNGSGNHGYVFVNCRFTAPAGISGTFLGRIDPAGFPYSEVVVLDSKFGDAANNALLATASGVSGSNYLGGWWMLNNASSASAAPNVHNWDGNVTDANGNALANPNNDGFTTMPSDAATQANYRNATWVLNTNLAGTVGGSWTPALAPLIAAPPVSQVVTAGDAVTFRVTAIGIPAPTYQWRKNGFDIPGATSSVLTIPVVQGTDTGGYTVVVSNSAGSLTSAEATLTVNGVPVAPVITQQPSSQLIAEGGSGTLNVFALGTTPLAYQWYRNGNPIAGATASSYSIVNAGLSDSGSYTVVISNSVGDTPSNAAIVTVKGIATIAKTGYAADVTGGAAGEMVTVTTATDLKNYAKAAEPYTIIVVGTIDLGENGRVNVTSNKTIRGATVASTILGTLSISNATNVLVSNLNISADTGAPSTNDGVTIANSTKVLVTKCTIYNCTDGNLDVINGSDLVTVSWCKFYYTRDNGHNFSNLVGSSDTDVGSGDGLANYRVTWHHNWWTGLAKQRMIACRFGSAHMFNNYWDCANNDYCTESRNIASIFSEHNYYDGVKNPLAKRTALPTDLGKLKTIGNIFDACTGNQETGSDLVFTPPYSYALHAAASVPAIVMAGAGNVTTDDSTANSAAISSSAPFGTVGGSLTLTAVPAGFVPTSYQWRVNNVDIVGATSATLVLTNLQPSHAGAYTLVLGAGAGEFVVSTPFTLATKFPPAISTQPESRTATVGDTVTFSVGATGDTPLAYQWHKNGAALAGATSATLELTGITTAAAGDYHCLVSNVAGSATSAIATLTVQKATASVTVTSASVTYDGTAKTLAVATVPAGLPVVLSYNGSTTVPADAGSYTVEAAIDHVDYVGTGSGTLTIVPANASVTLDGLAHVYDGSPKAASATTVPAGLPVVLSYDGGADLPTDAGAYAVVATVKHANYVGSTSGTLVIGKAAATITLAPLVQRYDGTPKAVTATTIPAGLTVVLAYDGGAAAPVYPGTHDVVATINDRNYSGTHADMLVITATVLTRQLPTLEGAIEGSVQVLAAEDVTLKGSAMISGDLLVPGTPSVRVNGRASFVGTREAGGSAAPEDAIITLGGESVLRYLVRRVDPIAFAPASAPAAPQGTRRVVLNRPGAALGDVATLLDLTLRGNAGDVVVPPGNYGAFTADGGSSFVLGVAGATEPALYGLQTLTLNGDATIKLVGPVTITLANGLTFASSVGSAVDPAWLTLRVAAGSVTLNDDAVLHGTLLAPNSAVTLNSNAVLHGRVECDHLAVDDGAVVEDPVP